MATDDDRPNPPRAEATGSKFMILGRENWARLIKSKKIENPLNAACAYLVMLAGTGPDNATTSWSARSFETYLGMRKSNGQKAIESLCAAGLVRVEKAGSRPRYKLLDAPGKDAPEEDCIFLPNQLVTGFGSGTSVLRRLRETGERAPLFMLIDLYGCVQDDLTMGLDGYLYGTFSDGHDHPIGPERKFGANSIWAIDPGHRPGASGHWWQHAGPSAWSAIQTLLDVKAIEKEPWLFYGVGEDADPIIPWDQDAESWSLSAAESLCEDGHLETMHGKIIVLASHVRGPSIRDVYRPAVMADTPRRRARYHEVREAREAAFASWREISGAATNVVPFSAARRVA